MEFPLTDYKIRQIRDRVDRIEETLNRIFTHEHQKVTVQMYDSFRHWKNTDRTQSSRHGLEY